jgi:hypothetical protein
MSDTAVGKFDIVAKQDPLLSEVVPAARRRVCQNTKIPESARMFFLLAHRHVAFVRHPRMSYPGSKGQAECGNA